MASTPKHTAQREAGFLRQTAEFLVSLGLLVALSRAFLAEGFVIETGSMAPCLRGRHLVPTCPDCGCQTAVDGNHDRGSATCSNCGSVRLRTSGLPTNEGDQLLVDRMAFELRTPRRWEVVVFRNPLRAREPFVKRVVGLPGESVQVRGGDLFINGRRAAKSLEVFRSMAVLVNSTEYTVADDPDWQRRWTADDPAAWTVADNRFESQLSDDWSGLTYRHWIRRGGVHGTSVALPEWPANVLEPSFGDRPVRFDRQSGRLISDGAMPASVRENLLDNDLPENVRSAIERLYWASHVAQITDMCAYNPGSQVSARNVCRDLLLSCQFQRTNTGGAVAFEITRPPHLVRVEVDFAGGEVRLIESGETKPSTTVPLPTALSGPAMTRPAEVELAVVDGVVHFAVNQRLVLTSPLRNDEGAEPEEPRTSAEKQAAWRPARVFTRNLQATLTDLRLFRDVYYTRGQKGRGVDSPVKLREDEFFVLGDNSPASQDMRDWPAATAVRREDLLGKPFLVHLPSRRIPWTLFGRRVELRIPEFSRMRYIR
jgi:signal peptidase I